jgi:hypothetical protein
MTRSLVKGMTMYGLMLTVVPNSRDTRLRGCVLLEKIYLEMFLTFKQCHQWISTLILQTISPFKQLNSP